MFRHRFIAILSVSILLLWGFYIPAEAALGLNVNPSDGGNTLRLGRVDGIIEATKSVKLRITSDEGKQYQVFQRLEDSLTNERQNILDSQTLNSYALSGSNASGTIYAQYNEPLGPADQLVYTSAPDGQSDTLTLIYTVNAERINASGNFIGRIAYVVRSLGGGSQDQTVLNVYLEASGDLKIRVEGAQSPDSIRLELTGHSNKEDGVKVSFSGNAGDEIAVYQEVQNFVQNEAGTEINNSSLLFATSGAQGELYHPSPEALGHKRVLIYRSKEAEDEFSVNFSLDPQTLGGLKAGLYRGRIVWTVESSQGPKDFPLDIEIKIEPIFELAVALPPQGVHFARVLPTDPPQEEEVKVTVKTNLGKPYAVMQNVSTPLTTAKGEAIKKDFFTFKTELLERSTGRSGATEFTPVDVGETPVFFSDREGSPTEFKVIYRLKSYPGIAAGDYTAPIVFSLGEM